MSEKKKPNLLVELLKARGGCLPIRVLVEVLGPEEYSGYLEDMVTRGEEDPDGGSVFYEAGQDYPPTHVCLDSWLQEWMFDKIDTALEETGNLSPRTKGLKKH